MGFVQTRVKSVSYSIHQFLGGALNWNCVRFQPVVGQTVPAPMGSASVPMMVTLRLVQGPGDPEVPLGLSSPSKPTLDGRDVACQGNPTLENLHDGITHAYAKAIYKLKRLK